MAVVEYLLQVEDQKGRIKFSAYNNVSDTPTNVNPDSPWVLVELGSSINISGTDPDGINTFTFTVTQP